MTSVLFLWIRNCSVEKFLASCDFEYSKFLKSFLLFISIEEDQ